MEFYKSHGTTFSYQARQSIDEETEKAFSEGHDGLIAKNIRDVSMNGFIPKNSEENFGSTYVIKDKEQIKNRKQIPPLLSKAKYKNKESPPQSGGVLKISP
jgi:hypothetical protein